MIQLLQYKIPIGYRYDSNFYMAEGIESKTYQFDLYMDEIGYIKYCLRNHLSYSISKVMTNHMNARLNYVWGLVKHELIDDTVLGKTYKCYYKLSYNQQQMNIIIL